MKRQGTIIILFIAILSTIELQGAEPYKIVGPPQDKILNLKLRKYHAIHHLNESIFEALKLNKRFNAEARHKIILTMLSNLSNAAPTRLIIPDFKNQKDLIIALRLIPAKQGKYSLILASNYSFGHDAIIEEKKDFGRAYARLFLIRNSILLQTSHLFSEEKMKKLKQAGHLLTLADSYLLDEKPENDDRGMQIVKNLYQAKSPVLEKLFALLTIGQFYLVRENVLEAEKVRKIAVQYLANNQKHFRYKMMSEILAFYIIEMELMAANPK